MDPPPPYAPALHMKDSDDEDAQTDNQSDKSSRHRDPASYKSSGKGLKSSVNMSEDGRINISMHLNKRLPDLPPHYAYPIREFAIDHGIANPAVGIREGGTIPRMSIVIMIVGSRGDVQPFLALGQQLLREGHRVRIATHGTFRAFVQDAGLEFFDIGGDPHDLMSYMVKNPGLMPGWTSLTNGDISRKQKMLSDILDGCWNACSQPDIDNRPFIADAIISNPPAFAHVHCAEALGVPLQLSFTMPWSPTTAFPHPLVNISQSNAEPGLTNYLSYGLAEMMTWQGLGGVINEFRTKKLGLEPLSVRSGPGILDRLKVPWTYCFSRELIHKPTDWQNHIDVVGFYFLNLASSYTPASDLSAFLVAGPPPIYIGFGSVVVEDPVKMTRTIFEATEKAGVRALVSAGWGGLGDMDVPPHIFILGNVPHDWLFTKVFAVCHHGGAGTTAIGLRLGKPTIVVPFFGDQPFWGARIHKSGAGPKPIKKAKMSVDRLASAIEVCKTQEASEAARLLGEQIRAQDGVRNGVESFYRHLPLLNMRCDILPNELAVWWSSEYCLKLSAVAAQVLNEERLLNIHKLEIHRPKEYDTRAKTNDPVTGGVVEALRCVTTLSESVAQIFKQPTRGMINTTTAIPRSIVHILDSFADGLSNTPALYGSSVRQPGQMKDFKSGIKEGGKAFFFGLSDGITGLWTEPVEGFKTRGWKGLVEGSMRSYVNVAMRPAAGSLSLFTYPLRGALRSLNHHDSSMERYFRQLRVDQGRDATTRAPSEGKLRLKEAGHVPEETDEAEQVKPSKNPSPIRRREETFERHLRGLHVAPPNYPAMNSGSRTKIVELFKIACRKENLVKRKKAMHKRIQWIITNGGMGSLSQLTAKEDLRSQSGMPHKLKHKNHQKRPNIQSGPASGSPSATTSSRNSLPPLSPSPRQSPSTESSSRLAAVHAPITEWTEEDEDLFSRQIEAARQSSLHENSRSPLEGRTYEEALLEAAAQWTEETDSPQNVYHAERPHSTPSLE